MAVTKTDDTETIPGTTISKFTGSGSTTWTCPAGVTEIEILLVAGGASGAFSRGGGGGAGGLIAKNVTVTPSTEYNITIGAGGVGTTSSPYHNPGGNSTAFGETTVS